METQLKENPIKDSNKTNAKKQKPKRFYYSFFTFVLLICLLQIGRSAIISSAKFIDLNYKLSKLNNINSVAKKENTKLKHQLEVYNSLKGAEEVARNNLKLTGKDEILVIIKD